MKRLLLALPLLLGACTGQQLLPPAMPSIQQVNALTAAQASIGDVPSFLLNGWTLARMNCGGYFDQAVMTALNSQLQQSNINTLSGALLAGLGLGGVGGPVVSGIGLGATTLNQLANNAMQNSLAGTDPAATATLVQAAQEALMQAEGRPVTPAEAFAALYDVYRVCSPTGIRQLQEQAIAAAPNHLQVVGGGAPAQFRAGAPLAPSGIRVPPRVVVR